MFKGNKLADSVAATDRKPMIVEDLVVFLRKEYYRVIGIYINRARDEHKKLFTFWKEHISETYRKLRTLNSKNKDTWDVPFAVHRSSLSAVPIPQVKT